MPVLIPLGDGDLRLGLGLNFCRRGLRSAKGRQGTRGGRCGASAFELAASFAAAAAAVAAAASAAATAAAAFAAAAAAVAERGAAGWGEVSVVSVPRRGLGWPLEKQLLLHHLMFMSMFMGAAADAAVQGLGVGMVMFMKSAVETPGEGLGDKGTACSSL